MAIKINIITVNYNNDRGLEATLQSIDKLKGLFDISVYVIDGGSSDSSREIVQKWSNIVTFWCSEPDNGIYDAMNKGIHILPSSHESFTIFINSDDSILTIPSKVLANSEDVLFFNVLSHDKKSGLKRVFKIYPQKSLTAKRLLSPKLHHQGFFVRTSILKSLEYRTDIGIRADVLLMGQALKLADSSYFGHEIVAEISTGGASDKYCLENLASFFRVAKILRISRIAVTLLGISELLKYVLKIALGDLGIGYIRKLQSKRVLPT